MKKEKHKKVKAVITIEMSFIIPIILGILVSVINVIFYYHDKNIILGAAIETAVVGAQIERKPDERNSIELDDIYRQRIQGKLVLFDTSTAVCEVTRKDVVVIASAGKGKQSIKVKYRAPILLPEKKIRMKKMIENQMGNHQEEGEEHREDSSD